jgi:hypothetical protein
MASVLGKIFTATVCRLENQRLQATAYQLFEASYFIKKGRRAEN